MNLVPPLLGFVLHAILVPPLPRWATFFRPWRDWRKMGCRVRGVENIFRAVFWQVRKPANLFGLAPLLDQGNQVESAPGFGRLPFWIQGNQVEPAPSSGRLSFSTDYK
jgi:hypothetical protein